MTKWEAILMIWCSGLTGAMLLGWFNDMIWRSNFQYITKWMVMVNQKLKIRDLYERDEE